MLGWIELAILDGWMGWNRFSPVDFTWVYEWVNGWKGLTLVTISVL